jgi:hypothetical protein
MNSIEQDLAALGETPDEVAGWLRQFGIKGFRYSPSGCPIYRYLHDRQGHTEILGVDTAMYKGQEAVNITFEYNCDGSHATVIPGEAVHQFIDAFDDGMYDDLNDRR